MKKSAVLLAVALALAGCKKNETPTPATQSTTTTAPTQRGQAPATVPFEPGTMMAAYTAKNLDGSKFDLAARRDKVVLLNLWATWCPPCRVEIPELQRLHDAYAARGFEVVGVSIDEGEPAEVEQFVTDQKITYPIVLDPEQKLPNLLETSMLPTSLLIGRDGRIVWKRIGAILEGDQELKQAIEKTL
jgi:cytochrome c biogenesis protein CcmG, thiol:disulfide interchange protein DsbE